MVVRTGSVLPRQKLTVAEYHRQIDAGVLTEDDKVELLHGELVPKMPIGDEHCSVVAFLNAFLMERVVRRAIVQVQNPIVLKDSEPESDLALAKYRQDYYRSGKPRASDTLLVIEVADSSLEKDRDVKGPIYAENGIPEYWIINLVAQVVEIYRNPQANGTWGTTSLIGPGGQVSPLAFPDVMLPVDEVLRPRNLEAT